MSVPATNRARRRRIYKQIARPLLTALAEFQPEYGPIAPDRVRIRQAWLPPAFYQHLRWPDYWFVEGLDTPIHRPLLTEIAPEGLVITWSGKNLIDMGPMSQADFRKEDTRWQDHPSQPSPRKPPRAKPERLPSPQTSTSIPNRPFLTDPTRSR